jgi:hypothetical protein
MMLGIVILSRNPGVSLIQHTGRILIIREVSIRVSRIMGGAGTNIRRVLAGRSGRPRDFVCHGKMS